MKVDWDTEFRELLSRFEAKPFLVYFLLAEL